MTKGAVLHQFFNQFLTFYAASSVPEDVIFPYGTYELITDNWDGGEVGLTVNLWFHTESEAIPNAKAAEIAKAIVDLQKPCPCEGGYVWFKLGHPWSQSLSDDTAPGIKRRYLNVTVEYLTKY